MTLHKLFEKSKLIDTQLSGLGHAMQDGDSDLLSLLGAALSGDVEQALTVGDLAEDVSAAELNAADAGAYSKFLFVQLQTTSGKVHAELSMQPVITPAESVADADVGAPTAAWFDTEGVGNPLFLKGMLRLIVIFDTDAGATKTYAPGDSVTVTIDVSGIPVLANVANLVKTFNVIA